MAVMVLSLPVDSRPFAPASPERTVLHVGEDVLPEEPTVPLGPILVAADGQLVFVPRSLTGEAEDG